MDPGWALHEAEAFTELGYRGNPTAVVVGDSHPPARLMQDYARGSGHSEVVFAAPSHGAASDFDLRFFAPKAEVPQCGHATLAAAAVLFRQAGKARLAFQTLGGLREAHERGGRVELRFPADPPAPVAPPAALLEAIGIASPVATLHSPRSGKLLVVVGDPAEVRALRPDFAAMVRAEPGFPVKGAIVAARATGPYDFVSRYFNPWVGVDEDPATGNAHCVMAPYWRQVLGKEAFLALQASPRGGVLEVEFVSDGLLALRGQVRTQPPKAWTVAA